MGFFFLCFSFSYFIFQLKYKKILKIKKKSSLKSYEIWKVEKIWNFGLKESDTYTSNLHETCIRIKTEKSDKYLWKLNWKTNYFKKLKKWTCYCMTGTGFLYQNLNILKEGQNWVKLTLVMPQNHQVFWLILFECIRQVSS